MYVLYYRTSKKNGCALYYGMEGVYDQKMEETMDRGARSGLAKIGR